MQLLIETLIYLLACLGIILITASFFSIIKYQGNFIDTYSIFNKKNKKIELVVKFYNIPEDQKNLVMEKIKKGDYKNIEDIVDKIDTDSIDKN